MAHQQDVLLVQHQTSVQPIGVELLLQVLLHPGLDVEDPLGLVVDGGGGEERPALHYHDPVAGNSTTFPLRSDLLLLRVVLLTST